MICCAPKPSFIICECSDRFSIRGEKGPVISSGTGSEFSTKYVAGGRLFPELNYIGGISIHEETTIGGEGHIFDGAGHRNFLDEGTLNIPYP